MFRKNLQCSEMQEEIVQGSCGISDTGGLKKLWSASIKIWAVQPPKIPVSIFVPVVEAKG